VALSILAGGDSEKPLCPEDGGEGRHTQPPNTKIQRGTRASRAAPVGLDAQRPGAYRPPTMKTIVYPLVGVGAVLLVSLSLAGEPAGPGHPRQAGRVLVLRNEQVLQGEVERVGDRYHVRREIGSTWVPLDQALYLCDNLGEAYTFVRRRANLSDPDERLRLAHWCRLHGLGAQALEEARAALALRPDDGPTGRLVRLLQERARSPKPPAPPPEPEGGEEASLPPVDVDADTLSAFATRVQPILMNTCLRCHASGRERAFHLRRVASPGLINRRSTQHNLAAVLRQVDYARPEASPLLTKAVSDHAQVGRAPLGGRDEPTYRALVAWLRATLKNNPHLARQAGVVGRAPAPVAPPPPVFRPEDPGRTEWGEARAAAPITGPVARPLQGAARTPPPARTPPRDLPIWARAFRPRQMPDGDVRPASAGVTAGMSGDPYDPAAFNRQGTAVPGGPAAPAYPPSSQAQGVPPQPLSVAPTPGAGTAPGTPAISPADLAPYSPGGPWQVGVVRPRHKSSRSGTARPSNGRNP
jgi:hypothetical protein